MPTYTLRHKETGEETDVFMSYSSLESHLQLNPLLEQVLKPIAIVDPYAVGRKKVDSAFNERLKQIKKNNPGNSITTGNLTTI